MQRQEIVDRALDVRVKRLDVARRMDVIERSYQVQPHQHAEKLLGAARRIVAAQQPGLVRLVQPFGQPFGGERIDRFPRAQPAQRIGQGQQKGGTPLGRDAFGRFRQDLDRATLELLRGGP